MKYRLSLDLGTNSIGWCVLNLDEQNCPTTIVRSGVRIFKDGRNPKDKTSLAVARRLARQMRRRRDRYLKRRDRLVSILVSRGLMPGDKVDAKKLIELDPYMLRAKGLDEALAPWELGRALFHINQRRGFKSNRKMAAGDDEEKGAIKGSISRTQEEIDLAGFRTAGEYLYDRRLKSMPVRARHRADTKDYELYFDRAMTETEVTELLSSQKRFMPEVLTDECIAEILDTILHQRPLRPVDPGRCTFEPNEQRAPQALPVVQDFRILQELNSLRVIAHGIADRELTLPERDILFEKLKSQQKMTFGGMRKALELPRDSKFNLESEKRKFLLGDQTGSSIGSNKNLGADWFSWPSKDQEKLVSLLLDATSDELLISTLTSQFGFSNEDAWKLAGVNLPDGYSRLGPTAISRITEQLKADVVVYSVACKNAGYNHSDFYTGEFYKQLPYYGEVIERHIMPGTGDPDDPLELRIGRISNPTVHITLNQLRKVVNGLIDYYGHPEDIHVETTRDLKISKDRKREIEQQQKANQERNEVHAKKLGQLGLPNNYENRLRLRLWEELNQKDPFDRRCPYSGTQISLSMLFSPQVEIEHLLPFARSLDDSIANKSISIRKANKDKGNLSPYEAFGDSRNGYDWTDILARASQLPRNKSWRFDSDAMDKIAEKDDFLARHLNDTAYISRVSREYLSAICPPKHIRAIPGRLTGLLRRRWGLNTILSDTGLKERTNHCHHAIDAIVVGYTDRSTLQRISTANSHDNLNGDKIAAPEPFENFRSAVEDSISRIAVSHRPDHGVNAQLHNDTAYGLAGEINGKPAVVSRKSLAQLTTPKHVDSIRDACLKESLQQVTKGLSGKEFRAAIDKFSDDTGTKRVRVLENLKVIPIENSDGVAYKGYKGDANYCIEIYVDAKGRWKGNVITRFVANQKDYRNFMSNRELFHKSTIDGEPLVMRLCVDDIIALGEGEGRELFRVVKMSARGELNFALIDEGGALKARNSDENDDFKYLSKSPGSLQTSGARKVFITPVGFVLDPR